MKKIRIEKLLKHYTEGLRNKRLPIENLMKKAKTTTDIKGLSKTKEEFIEKVRPLNYEEWKNIILENFPQAVFETEACASVMAQLLIKDVSLPFGLVLIGAPSSLKTTVLNFFSEYDRSLKIDQFTPASFVSHAKVMKDKLEEIDLLPKIKDKVLIVPDLAPIFGMRREDLLKNVSILTRVFDGSGLRTASGLKGLRGYVGDYLFMFLSASTPIPPSVWKIMGTLGHRLYFLSTQAPEKEVKDYVAQLTDKASYKEKLEACKFATERFLCHLFDVQYPEGVEWNRKNDPREVMEAIVKYAMLLSCMRGIVSVQAFTYMKEGEEREVLHHSVPIIENPDRACLMLYSLARGHALLHGRTQLSNEDLAPIRAVALNSAPIERTRIIEYLMVHNGTATSTQIREDLNLAKSTVHRTIKTLELLGIIITTTEYTETPQGKRKTYEVILRDEFQQLAKASQSSVPKIDAI